MKCKIRFGPVKVYQDDMTKVKWLEKVIQKNKHMLKTGSTFTQKELCEMLSITPSPCPVRHNMQKFRAYTSLNKLLKLRGLVIRSHDYYSHFEVLNKDEAECKTVILKHTALSKRRYSSELKSAIYKFNCKWTELDADERKQVARNFSH